MTEELIREARAFAALGSDLNPVEANRLIFELADELAAAAISGSTSDGHHTFDELYDYRMLYNAHAAHGWLAAGIPVVKSWKHSNGELCFGGGWFIVTATLPAGQVSNHYKAEHWGLFTVPEVDLPPEYDGHTPQDAAERLRAAAGAAPQEHDEKPADLSIMNGWLVESVGKHTCGAGMDGYGHEPGCGYVPMLNLAELDGYPAQVDEAKIVAAIADELETDDAIAENWSNSKVNATARRLVQHAVLPVLRGEDR